MSTPETKFVDINASRKHENIQPKKQESVHKKESNTEQKVMKKSKIVSLDLPPSQDEDVEEVHAKKQGKKMHLSK